MEGVWGSVVVSSPRRLSGSGNWEEEGGAEDRSESERARAGGVQLESLVGLIRQRGGRFGQSQPGAEKE
jgi:hypothetical protein